MTRTKTKKEESFIHDGVALKIQKIFIEWLKSDRSITAKKLHVNIVTALGDQ
jgi:hypothetical protein